MQNNSSFMLQVSNACSSRCAHCPYSLEKNTISKQSVLSQIEKNSSSITIVSGGEPFEHPFLHEFLTVLEKKKTSIFRIATGGHVDLSSTLQEMQKYKFLSGISFGTDQFFEARQKNQILKTIWEKNLKILDDSQFPYSMTVTLGKDLIMEELKSLAVFMGALKLQFILLQNSELQPIDESEYNMYYEVFKQNNPGVLIKNECNY